MKVLIDLIGFKIKYSASNPDEIIDAGDALKFSLIMFDACLFIILIHSIIKTPPTNSNNK
jgi:hypothetical protein